MPMLSITPPQPLTCRRVVASAWMVAVSAALLACASKLLSKPVEGPPRWVSLPDEALAERSPGSAAALGAEQRALHQAALRQSDHSLRLLDSSQWRELWRISAPFLRAANTEQQAFADIEQRRQALGPIQGRARAGVHGVRMAPVEREGQGLPIGRYVDVEYTGELSNGATTVETLRLRLEPEGWRFAGYTAQLTSAPWRLGAALPAAR